MVSRKSYTINANEDFVLWFTSELLTCFIDTNTSGMKSQSIDSLYMEWKYTRTQIYMYIEREREREKLSSELYPQTLNP